MQAADRGGRLGMLILAILGSCFALSHAQFPLAQSIDFRSVTDSLDKRRQENPASKPI
jgi:hypothetical protein